MAVVAPIQPFEHLVLDFLAYLEFERGLSRNTLDAYRSDLLQLGAHLKRTGVDGLTATNSDLADFVADLAAGSELRPPVRSEIRVPSSRRNASSTRRSASDGSSSGRTR